MSDTNTSELNKQGENDGSQPHTLVEEQQKQKNSSKLVAISKNFQLDLEDELPEYSPPGLKAYRVTSLSDTSKSYFGIVTEPHLPCRAASFQSYANVMSLYLAKLVSAAIVSLPGHKGQRTVIVYEDNLGTRLFQSDIDVAAGWSPEKVMSALIKPTLHTLKDLRDHDLFHGGIRPSNLYNGRNKNFTEVILGESLSLPASYSQPALFEPMDRSLAEPIGRGLGSKEDDLYALGVTAAMLLRSSNPLATLTEEEIYTKKLQEGTYGILFARNERITGAILEFLRGVLIDDRRQRWTLDEAISWMDGRRLSPKQVPKPKRAGRALAYNNKNYFYAETFARDIFKNPPEAVSLIEDGEIEAWILRSLDDEVLHNRFVKALGSASEYGTGQGYHDRLLSRVALALNPTGPMRFKSICVNAEGLGNALVSAFISGANLETFREFFEGNYLSYWLTTLTEANHDVLPYMSNFEACRVHMNERRPGSGIERCLYILNEDIHCLSPILKRFMVKDPEDLIKAFDQIVTEDPTTPLLDQHILAFLCQREPKTCEPFLFDLGSDDLNKRRLGVLQVLGAIQKYHNVGDLDNLCSWAVNSIDVLLERYHDRRKREDLEKKFEKLKERGDITRIILQADNPDELFRDYKAFRRAMVDYKQMQRELDALGKRLERPETFGKKQGREIAAIVSGVVASLIIMGFIFIFLSGNGGQL